MTGIPLGSLIDIFHRLGRYLLPAMDSLKERYREDPVKHADETGGRNDGQHGYAWRFCTALLRIFLFKNTRSASVPKSVFGGESLPGVLVVDRYNAYNKLPLKIQYCSAHLLGDLEKPGKDFLDEEEVTAFTSVLIPLLSQSMHLHSPDISDVEYYRTAEKLRREIMKTCRSPARHLGIRAFQEIFTAHEDRLFHWVADRRVPADNNRGYAARGISPRMPTARLCRVGS